MCEIKTVLIVAALKIEATGFCIYQVIIAKSRVKVLAKNRTKSLHGGECYYLVGEDIVASNCTWLYGGERCEKYMWWT